MSDDIVGHGTNSFSSLSSSSSSGFSLTLCPCSQEQRSQSGYVNIGTFIPFKSSFHNSLKMYAKRSPNIIYITIIAKYPAIIPKAYGTHPIINNP